MRYGHFSESDQRILQSRCKCESQPVQRAETPSHPLLKFQQTIGNRAVGRLIQAKGKFNPSAHSGGRRIHRVCTECEQETRRPEEKKEKRAGSSGPETVQTRVDEDTEEEPEKGKAAGLDLQRQGEPEEEEEPIARMEASETKTKGEDQDDEFKIKSKPEINFSIVQSDRPPTNAIEGKRQACPAPAAAPQRHRGLDSTAAQVAGMGACTWGITSPDTLGISTQTCRDGANWRLVITQVNSVVRSHSRLLAGQREPVPDVNTTAGNFCNQVTELDTLGVCPGAWYMIRAVFAHENVHVHEWLDNFTADWNPLETAIEGLRVPAAGATASRAAATAALRADPVFVNARDTSRAGGNFGTFWGIPDPNANTNAAETAVVTPRIQWICKTAGWRRWNPAGCPVCVAQGIV